MPQSHQTLVDPSRDRMVHAPSRREPTCWVGGYGHGTLAGRPALTRRLRGPQGRGHTNVVSMLRGGPWEAVFILKAGDARCGAETVGTRSVEKMAVADVDGRQLAIYCALDGGDGVRHDRWDMWAMWGDGPADWDPREAQRVATDDWDDIPGQAGGRKDPTIVLDAGGISLLYVGWETERGPATTFRATWDGSRFVPEAEPLFAPQGCAAAEARVTDVVTLTDGRQIILADVAADRTQNTRETGVWLPVPDGGLSQITFGAELPALVAPAGQSCRYHAVVSHGNERWVFYEAALSDIWNEAHGGMRARYTVDQFEALF